MKLNWGTAIAIFYGSFMAILLFFVIRSTSYPHSLVVDNYYEQDLNYQKHYEKISNADALGVHFRIDYEAEKDQLTIRFPEEQVIRKGSVTLFKPADSRQDFKQEMEQGTSGVFRMSTSEFSRGHWKVQVDWEADGKTYYRETEIYF